MSAYQHPFSHREASRWNFTEPEQSILKKTARRFARELREAGFLDREG